MLWYACVGSCLRNSGGELGKTGTLSRNQIWASVSFKFGTKSVVSKQANYVAGIWDWKHLPTNFEAEGLSCLTKLCLDIKYGLLSFSNVLKVRQIAGTTFEYLDTTLKRWTMNFTRDETRTVYCGYKQEPDKRRYRTWRLWLGSCFDNVTEPG